MVLLRLADVPRTVRRLTPPVPLHPDASMADEAGHEQNARVGWMLRPELLDPADRRVRARIARVIALYRALEGQPRTLVDARQQDIEGIMGHYRVARCVARAIEGMGYHFAPPPRSLPDEPAHLRALCYRRSQEQYGGYVPRASRNAFLARVAADLDVTADALEVSLWADRAGAALLVAGPAVAQEVTVSVTATGAPPRPEDVLDPTQVIAAANAAMASTLLAASALVTLQLPAAATAALKDLYRHGRAVHVGIEIAVASPLSEATGKDEDKNANEEKDKDKDLLNVTLYGPGSRALVRRRTAQAEGGDPEGAAISMELAEAKVRAGAGAPATEAAPDPEAVDADLSDEEDHAGEALDTLDTTDTADAAGAVRTRSMVGRVDVSAPGGGAVAAVVMRLVRRHPQAVRGGWTRLLGPDGRLFHVPLDEPMRAALGASKPEAEVEMMANGDGDSVPPTYDSAVEAAFARAFLAAQAGGRLGVAHGWRMEREPRALVVGASVFLPDFSFNRGGVEVFAEVVGYYTEDYLARKKRKLVQLQGRIALLLIVDRELAPLFAETGYPLITYQAGKQVNIMEVVGVLDSVFDPFARRRSTASRTLTTLCQTEGERLTEEEVCALTGCAGRSELRHLWADVRGASASATIAPAAGSGSGSGAGPRPELRFARQYLPGYGLAPAAAVAQARDALTQVLDETGGGVPLEEAVAWCTRAGLPDADEALLGALGMVVIWSGLFGEACVYPAGTDSVSIIDPRH